MSKDKMKDRNNKFRKSKDTRKQDIRDDHKQETHYGLSTAITMIIGIVIGSGIYFKADDVLNYTDGNIWLGVLVFCIGAFGIIFGSLTLTELSMRTKKNGGIVGYYEDFISKKAASGFGWFQTFVYYPTITVVISWVAGIYTCQLLGLESTLERQIWIGFAYMTVFYIINILSVTLGGYIQNLSTAIKLIPLIAIALISIFWSVPNPSLSEGVESLSKSSIGMGWLAALAPVAYSFDGWTVATSITNEIKNPKKNMTIALIIGPIIVLSVYLLYFLGLNKLLGPEYIMSTGDGAVNKVGEMFLGKYGSKVILIFITIAITGVLNGIVLGHLRMPQALASKKMLPKADKITRIHPKIKLSPWSCLISYIISIFWLLVHYITQKNNLLIGGDVSEIAIVFSYVSYIILYIKVLKMKKEGIIRSKFKGILSPILGILGSSIILIGGYLSNPVYVTFFLIFCLLICVVGFIYYDKSIKNLD
ncbi:MAG: APC family permease [Clostridiales bacterium]|nr:APC family permease [Clostridiales bacterium]